MECGPRSLVGRHVLSGTHTVLAVVGLCFGGYSVSLLTACTRRANMYVAACIQSWLSGHACMVCDVWCFCQDVCLQPPEGLIINACVQWKWVELLDIAPFHPSPFIRNSKRITLGIQSLNIFLKECKLINTIANNLSCSLISLPVTQNIASY